RLDEALAVRKEAIERLDSLANGSTGKLGVSIELADLCASEGTMLWRSGRFVEAANLRNRGRSMLEERLRLSPEDSNARNRLAATEMAISEEYAQLGLWREGAPHAIRASELRGEMSPDQWFRAAVTMWMGGDEAAFLRHFAGMQQQFPGS